MSSYRAQETRTNLRSNPQVLLVTNIPTPYRIPLFNELYLQLAAQRIAFKVIFAALGYPRRRWEIDMSQCTFPWEVLNSGRIPSRDPERAFFSYAGLGRILRSNAQALTIVAGFSIGAVRVFLRSLCRRTPYIIWSEAINRKDGAVSRIRRWQRRLLIDRASGYIACGSRARDYLVGLGAEPSLISIGINTVDIKSYSQASLRRQYLASDRTKEFVCVGELSRRKRVDLLLVAIARLAADRQDFVLRLIGTGAEEGSLIELVRTLRLENRVVFEGFKQNTEVADFLARADCFVFPTSFDIWGLVLVEAMAAGLTCLSSIHAGATHDLVTHGVNGFAVDFEDAAEVVRLLHWILDHPEECRQIGERASQFINQNASISKSAAGFVDAIRSALNLKQVAAQNRMNHL